MLCHCSINVRRLCAWVCIVLLPAFANAHPFHASTTEIEWNSASERFEVAMKLRIVDLEDAISVQQGRRFRLEHSPDLKPLLQQYLQQHFAITFAEHTVCHLTWIGHELELHDVWIYFEARSLPGNNSDRLSAVEATMSENSSAVAQAAAHRSQPAILAASRKLTWDELLAPDRTQPTPSSRQVRIRSSLLVDVQREQVNLVVLTFANKVLSATLNATEPETVLEVP